MFVLCKCLWSACIDMLVLKTAFTDACMCACLFVLNCDQLMHCKSMQSFCTDHVSSETRSLDTSNRLHISIGGR